MEENKELLKYIYHEDLYIINEPVNASVSRETVSSIEEKITDPAEEELTSVQEVKPITFFGNNEKGILILVNDPNNEFLNQKELEFLMTIIEAGLQLSKTDIALVNISQYPYEQVLDELPCNYIISFDENEKSNTKYQVMHKEGKKILYAENLTTIKADKKKKRSLWNVLISMFNINTKRIE